jgi:hypothetical protein
MTDKPLEALKQAKEAIQKMIDNGEICDCEKCSQTFMPLLAQTEAGMVCPVCNWTKIEDKCIIGYKSENPCPACSGKGDYKSWAETQLMIADGKIASLQIELALAKRNQEENLTYKTTSVVDSAVNAEQIALLTSANSKIEEYKKLVGEVTACMDEAKKYAPIGSKLEILIEAALDAAKRMEAK